jgi:hypothetical protein
MIHLVSNINKIHYMRRDLNSREKKPQKSGRDRTVRIEKRNRERLLMKYGLITRSRKKIGREKKHGFLATTNRIRCCIAYRFAHPHGKPI